MKVIHLPNGNPIDKITADDVKNCSTEVLEIAYVIIANELRNRK